jgi:hypothetical protein
MSYMPLSMRKARQAGKAHYYVNPRTLDVYPNGLGRVRLTRKQLEQAIKVMDDFALNRGGVGK